MCGGGGGWGGGGGGVEWTRKVEIRARKISFGRERSMHGYILIYSRL